MFWPYSVVVYCNWLFVTRDQVETREPWLRRWALWLTGTHSEALRRLWQRVRSPLNSGSCSEGKLPMLVTRGDTKTILIYFKWAAWVLQWRWHACLPLFCTSHIVGYRLQQTVSDHQPRLFECSNKTGRFIVTEVTQFTQDDLNEDDVMLLDTWDQVCLQWRKLTSLFSVDGMLAPSILKLNVISAPAYLNFLKCAFSHHRSQVFLWIGKETNEVERKESVVTSQEYLRTHPGARDPDTPIVLIKQGFEPPTFTGWFTAWDPSKWSVSVFFSWNETSTCS